VANSPSSTLRPPAQGDEGNAEIVKAGEVGGGGRQVVKTPPLPYTAQMTVAITWRSLSESRRRLVAEESARAARVLADLGARLVMLYGSHARGDASDASDVDLLVVIPRPVGEPIGARAADLLAHLAPRVALDLVVYTPEEFDELRGRTPLLRAALVEGEVLFERP
jgi:uncharacterized protein